MTDSVVQISKTIDAPAEAVWDALTSAEAASSYFMGARVDSDFQVGSPITFKGEWEGKSFEDKGEILEAEPERRLSFSHFSPTSGADEPENYHKLTFELRPNGDATEVVLTQDRLVGGPSASDMKNREQFEKNWREVLDGLSKSVSH